MPEGKEKSLRTLASAADGLRVEQLKVRVFQAICRGTELARKLLANKR
jgi:hypothetical protein